MIIIAGKSCRDEVGFTGEWFISHQPLPSGPSVRHPAPHHGQTGFGEKAALRGVQDVGGYTMQSSWYLRVLAM